VNTVIINQHPVHFEVGLFTLFLVRILDEGILKTVASLLITYDLTAYNLAEPGEDELQILVLGNGIQLANE
jgi:hypothetical protein